MWITLRSARKFCAVPNRSQKSSLKGLLSKFCASPRIQNIMLKIANLEIEVDNKKVLKGITLSIKPGELHVLMGPNGAGKTSLVMALLGKPGYEISAGEIILDKKIINNFSPDERVKLGLLASFQKPPEIPGVTLHNLLKAINIVDLEGKIQKESAALDFNQELLNRSWENFSGGEAKKIELFQAKILNPHFLILDELDSGLDIDALRLILENLKSMAKEKKTGILLITHNPKILNFLKPDYIHILVGGKIVKTGDSNLSKEIDKKGFSWLTKN